VEHVIPAGLGNHADLVLPRGAACARCNNHLGRQIDEALVHLLEVQFIRGYHRVPDRKGRLVDEIPLRNGTLTFPKALGIAVTVHTDEHLIEQEGSVRVTTIAKRGRSGDQWRRATRAILKMGLCLICCIHGQGEALSSAWDDLRAMIAGEPYEGYMLIGPFDVFAPPHLKASLLTSIPGVTLASRLRFGGLDLIADLEAGPANAEVQAWAQDNDYRVMDIQPL
jgi:hypothetical protein